MSDRKSDKKSVNRQSRRFYPGWIVPALLLPAISPAVYAQQSQSPDTTSGAGIMQDWLTRENMTEEQAGQLNSACCGMFVEPELLGENAALDPDSAPTEIVTPYRVSQPEPQQLYVEGDVTVRQGYRSLQASEGLHLNEATNILSLQGDVVFREPGFLVTGQGARIDQSSGDNTIEQASYVIHNTQIHGTASRLSYNTETGMMTMDNGEFSRCEPMDPFWLVQASSLRLDNERGVGYASELTLRLRDVPVFYYPYTVQFPIGDQRVSGILPPSISNSRDNGLDVALPYYFNLAPHYDATVTPRLMTERGLMLGGEFRYLSSWSMNTVTAELLPDDQTYDPARAGISRESAPQRQRWFGSFAHEGQPAQNWRTFVDLNAVSDADYFRDLGTRNLDLESRTHLNKEAVVSWQDANWHAETRLQRIQIIDPYLASIDINKPYDRLPEVRLSRQGDSWGAFRYGADVSHVRFDRSLERSLLSPAQLDGGALVTGSRMAAEPWVSMPLRGAGYFLIPTARYRYASWELDQQAVNTAGSPDRGVSVFSLDSGLIFERPVNVAGLSATQTLEPRLYYLYSEQKDQQSLPNFDSAQLHMNFNQLFRDNRFSGGDRVGDANQVSAAVTSRLLTNDGMERARISVGQIFHFKDRKVSLDSPLQNWLTLQPLDTDRSALVMEASYRPHSRWQLMTDLQWDQENSTIDQGSVALQMQGDQGRLFNVAFRYREKTDVFLNAPPLLDPRIKQSDISAVWPLNANWSLLGRWNYDHSNSRNLETFAGVEYSNCCATMRVIARDWVNDYELLEPNTRKNRGVFFQLSLHGLGDLAGGGLDSLLSNSIPGFKEQNSND
ncbi:MAG: LPS-assembly protein LptD [Pseudohongiella sp.]|nr:LPS-assembly protein LptD [Pseudohongiella sp.]